MSKKHNSFCQYGILPPNIPTSYCSKLIDGSNGSNPISDLFGSLTYALSNTSSNNSNFVGSFGNIDSVLNKFDLDFGFVMSLLSRFKEYIRLFADDMTSLSEERTELTSLRPRSLVSKYPALLKLGSKKASVAYSSELKGLLWDKLVEKFPYPTYNGVRIPGLPIDQNFREKYGSRGEFSVRDYLPHIAIAFGKSFSFQEKSARYFTMDDLFAPDFNVNLTCKVLTTLMETKSLSSNFSHFSGASNCSKMPIDPITNEVFNVRNYLADIQVAFGIALSTDLAAPNFALVDLKEALFPNVPSLRVFADSVKSMLVKEINDKLDGLFETAVDLQGFDEIKIGGNASSALNIVWPSKSTRAFIPKLRIDQVQGFSFDIDIDVSDSGSLSLDARFTFGAVGVNPIKTLSDITSWLSGELQGLSSRFEGLTSSLESTFSNASALFSNIANSDRIQLLFDANIDLIVSLSLPSFEVKATLEAFDASLTAVIGKVFVAIMAHISLVSCSHHLFLISVFSQRINSI